MSETLEELIAEINEDGWLVHGLSQYNGPRGTMWSATVRKKGVGRSLIGQASAYNAFEALEDAYVKREEGQLEPEVTFSIEKKQKISLASVRAALAPDTGPPLRRI